MIILMIIIVILKKIVTILKTMVVGQCGVLHNTDH